MIGKIGTALAVALLACLFEAGIALANDRRDCELEDKNPDRSIAACTRIIERGGNAKARAVAYWHRGNAWSAKPDEDKALADFEEAVRLDPRHVSALLNAASILAEGRDPDRALSYIERAVRVGVSPYGRRVATRVRGSAYLAKRLYDQAVSEFTALIRLDAKSAAAYGRRGEAYEAKGDIERALADYAKALEFDPKYTWVYAQRGAVFMRRGDLERALADFDKAISLNPKTTYSHYQRGRIYLRRGEIEKAQADFSRAIENDPKYSWGYRGRGEASFAAGDYAAAIAALDKAVELAPSDSSHLYFRGAVHLHSGAAAKALADLNAMSERDPTYVYGALMLDIASRGSKVASRLAELPPKIDMAKWPGPLVRLYLGQLSVEAALAAAEQSKEQSAVHLCEARYYAGKLAQLQDGRDEAVRLLKLAASECPRSEYERNFARAALRALGENP